MPIPPTRVRGPALAQRTPAAETNPRRERPVTDTFGGSVSAKTLRPSSGADFTTQLPFDRTQFTTLAPRELSGRALTRDELNDLVSTSYTSRRLQQTGEALGVGQVGANCQAFTMLMGREFGHHNAQLSTRALPGVVPNRSPAAEPDKVLTDHMFGVHQTKDGQQLIVDPTFSQWADGSVVDGQFKPGVSQPFVGTYDELVSRFDTALKAKGGLDGLDVAPGLKDYARQTSLSTEEIVASIYGPRSSFVGNQDASRLYDPQSLRAWDASRPATQANYNTHVDSVLVGPR
jgi:hypothetical protein